MINTQSQHRAHATVAAIVLLAPGVAAILTLPVWWLSGALGLTAVGLGLLLRRRRAGSVVAVVSTVLGGAAAVASVLVALVLTPASATTQTPGSGSSHPAHRSTGG